jgi:hypothetical protein
LAGGFVDNKPVKKKKCRICRTEFPPFSSTQVICGPKCAIELIYQNREKEFKRETKRLKEKIKTKAQWLREAQQSFNRYIRARDEGQACISCQQPPKKKNAGHWLSAGAHPELRFNEDNCHLQCEHCNSYLSGNQIRYRAHLIEKIGQERVDWLEGPHDAKHYTIDDLKEIKATYNARALELEKLQNN